MLYGALSHMGSVKISSILKWYLNISVLGLLFSVESSRVAVAKRVITHQPFSQFNKRFSSTQL